MGSRFGIPHFLTCFLAEHHVIPRVVLGSHDKELSHEGSALIPLTCPRQLDFSVTSRGIVASNRLVPKLSDAFLCDGVVMAFTIFLSGEKNSFCRDAFDEKQNFNEAVDFVRLSILDSSFDRTGAVSSRHKLTKE